MQMMYFALKLKKSGKKNVSKNIGFNKVFNIHFSRFM